MVLRKSEFAQELGIAKSGVSKLIQRGLPVRSDGKIDARKGCEWIITNVYGQGGPSIARANARELLDLLRRRASSC
jgi:hypothetical protein